MRWIFILALVYIVGAHIDTPDPDNEIECEPTWLNKTQWFFMKKFNVTRRKLFELNVIHKSKHLYQGNCFYRIGLSVKRTLKFEALRYHNATTVYNFYYGDTAKCHEFDPVTGEYTLTSLGFHSLKFFCTFKPGNLYTVDFEKHREESFALMGPMLVGNNRKMNFIDEDDALELFPQHADVIKTIYSRIEVADIID